jgi:DMSO/TMAO reductase YedYZ molybdopterin-dependent catalytic subunit
MKHGPGIETNPLECSAQEMRFLERRLLLKGALGVGALSLLSGCNITDEETVHKVLWGMSRWNDRMQMALFDPKRLAPIYAESDITHPFPFNAYYREDEAPIVDGDLYRLELSGLIRDRRPWSLAQLNALPQATQITRHVCVEGWSAIGKWSGVPFRTFLERVGADLNAKYVGFKCADDYYTSIDMASALHPQTQLTLRFADRTLPRSYGFPMKLRIPTKLGFKNPKHIMAIYVTNMYPGGYWEDKGYNWFAGL